MNRTLLLALVSFGALTAAGCNDFSNTTTGRAVTLQTALVADPALDGGAFDTETGWSVRLSRAALSLGALYYFEGEPAFVQRRSTWQHIARLFGPGVARAHPGHYVEGDATGQMTEARALELGTAPLTLPAGRGVTGLYRSGRFVLADAEDSQIEGLDGNVAFVEGVASKGEQLVHFRLAASFADVSRSVRQAQVNGCVFDEANVTADGTVTVTVKPRVWFNLVDFSDVAPGSAGDPTVIAAGETPQIAFALGVVQLSAYRFSFQRE